MYYLSLEFHIPFNPSSKSIVEKLNRTSTLGATKLISCVGIPGVRLIDRN